MTLTLCQSALPLLELRYSACGWQKASPLGPTASIASDHTRRDMCRGCDRFSMRRLDTEALTQGSAAMAAVQRRVPQGSSDLQFVAAAKPL